MMAAFCELPAKAIEVEASAAANTMFLNMRCSIKLEISREEVKQLNEL
jgi:hypothetical protein